MGEAGEHYKKTVDEILKELNTTKKGLTTREASHRLKKFGPNEITRTKKLTKTKIFLNQFKNIMIFILMIASAFSLLIGHAIDSIIILTVVIFNSIFGFIQENKAEKSIEALRRLTSLKSIVIRDGKETEIDSKEIIPGDILVLEAGNKVPADARIIESSNLEIDESSLTGESMPVKKDGKRIESICPISEQSNIVFCGTIVTKGRCVCVVTSTNMKTEIGKIAREMQEVKEEKTPLQERLEKLSKSLGIFIILIVIGVFFLNLKNSDYLTSLIFGISLAVAAIPEGLPAVVTITFALGVRRMIKKNALIRKLSSIETLGSIDIICTDKTGTLTKNQMTVRKIFANGKIIEVSGEGYNPNGGFVSDEKFAVKDIEKLLACGALCNDAELIFESDGSGWKVIGDPTEGALLTSAKKANINQEKYLMDSPRIDEVPFSSETKYMLTVHKSRSKKIVYAKGAPEAILGLCTRIITNGKTKKLDEKTRQQILDQYGQFANDAMRVLAFAYKEEVGKAKTKYENELIFLGLQAMIDPPRAEAKDAIARCKSAGIRTVMITGDFKITAMAIAKYLGIEGEAIDGNELINMSDEELQKKAESIGIYARVNPIHKLRIVAALQKNGHIVAMTGDGINDSPALKKANVGIAIGSGTDVAKEASHMIVTDDNFASIVDAIEEGRSIYDNIRKFLAYMFSTHTGEIFVIVGALLFGLPAPLTAIQLLWLNIVTDGFPALALSVDPKVDNIMRRKPRKPDESIITRNSGIMIFILSLMLAGGTILLMNYGSIFEPGKTNTLVLTALVVFEIIMAFLIRSEFETRLFSNRYLYYAVLSSIVLQLVIIYSPLNNYFGTIPLNSKDWIFILTIGLAIAGAAYALKKIMSLFDKDNNIDIITNP